MNGPVPLVRFTRDKRGYEHFYLIQPSRRGRDRQRILYWFRTPPGVKVGRVPFDEEARRTIESRNPGIRFEWKTLLDIAIPSPDTERWRERRRERAAARAAAAVPDFEEAPAAGEEAACVPLPRDVPGEESGSTEQPIAAEPGLSVPAEGDRAGRRKRRRRRRARSASGTPPVDTAPQTGTPGSDVETADGAGVSDEPDEAADPDDNSVV